MADTLHWTYRAAFTAQPERVAQARAFVSSHLGEAPLATAADAVTLVVSELATNAVLHAATPFTVSLSRRDASLRLEVRDRSARQVHSPTPQSPASTGGRGLQVVDACSTTWGVREEIDGKSVWATFELPPPSSDAAVAPRGA